MVALVIALVALVTVFVFDIGGNTDESADATVQFDETSTTITAKVLRNENVESFRLVDSDGSTVGTTSEIGSSIKDSSKKSGDYTVIAVMPDGSEEVLTRSDTVETSTNPLFLSSDGDIELEFGDIAQEELLLLSASESYNWEIIGGRFYPFNPSNFNLGADGGTTTISNTQSFSTEVDVEDDYAFIVLRDSNGNVQGTGYVYETSEPIQSNTKTYTLNESGNNENIITAYDGQIVTFRFNSTSGGLAPADWSLEEENGATTVKTPPSNVEEFTTEVDLSNPDDRGNFVIRADEPSTTNKIDTVRVYVLPSNERETKLVESEPNFSSPRCTDVSYDGSGTELDPYKVSSDYQLQCIIDNDLSANYKQTQDINLSGTEDWSNGGFIPVGNSSGRGPFTGTYDGNTYEINGLYINNDTYDYTGLFGDADADAEFKNIKLNDINVSSNSSNIGGLVGRNFGNINNSKVKGRISVDKISSFNNHGGIAGTNNGLINNSDTNIDIKGEDRVGGLVGRNNGILNNTYSSGGVIGEDSVGGLVGYNTAIIKNSNSKSNIANSNDNVGGLVGRNTDVGSSDDVAVFNSYSSGDVDGEKFVGGLIGSTYQTIVNNTYSTSSVTGDEDVGGLVGYHNSDGGFTVENSYSLGSVVGNKNVGGLIGFVTSDDNSLSVAYSYSSNSISGSSNLGGLVGSLDSGVIFESYWNKEVSNIKLSYGNINTGSSTVSRVYGLETREMQGSIATFHMNSLDYKSDGNWTIVKDDYSELKVFNTINNGEIINTELDYNGYDTVDISRLDNELRVQKKTEPSDSFTITSTGSYDVINRLDTLSVGDKFEIINVGNKERKLDEYQTSSRGTNIGVTNIDGSSLIQKETTVENYDVRNDYDKTVNGGTIGNFFGKNDVYKTENSGDKIDVNPTDELSLSDSSWTIVSEFYFNDSVKDIGGSSGDYTALVQTTDSGFTGLWQESNKLVWYDGGNVAETGTINPNQWYTGVATYNATTNILSLYLGDPENGGTVKRLSYEPSSTDWSVDNYTIGSRFDGDQTINGGINRTEAYNIHLNDTQVSDVVNKNGVDSTTVTGGIIKAEDVWVGNNATIEGGLFRDNFGKSNVYNTQNKGDNLTINPSSNLELGDSNWTVVSEFYFNNSVKDIGGSSGDYSALVQTTDSGFTGLWQNNNKLVWFDGGSVAETGTINPNQWYTGAATYNAKDDILTLHLGDPNNGGSSISKQYIPSESDWSIDKYTIGGRFDGDQTINGGINSTKFYDRKLTDEEISNLN